MDEYEILLNSINYPFHIMAFSETWLRNDNVDRVCFQDYEHVHSIRPLNNDIDDKEAGGGLSFFIKDGLNYNVCNEMNLMLPFIETLFIEVSINQTNYIIGLIYRVPNQGCYDLNQSI